MVNEIWAWIQTALTAVGAGVGWFIGGLDGLMIALICLMTLDYVTGVTVAIMARELSSRVGFVGICKKVLILALVGVAHVIDAYVLRQGDAIRTAVLFYYISNEGVSLLENAATVGLPVPKKLRDVLAQLHNRAEGDADENDNETEEHENGI